MARYVMIEIGDNDEADAFVEAVKNGALYFAYNAGNDEVGFRQPQGWKVPALWAKPTKFCDCQDKGETSAKTKKYGWWVHHKCAKPKPGAMQHPHNLLEVDKPVTERVFYLGFRADGRGWIIPREKK